MTKQKLFRFGFWGLLLLNIICITLLILGRPHHPPPGGPKGIIVEKLAFDNSQQQAYDALIDKHKQKLDALVKQKHALKEQLFQQFDQGDNEAAFAELGQIQVQLERAHIEHLLAIKNLCTTEQLPNFEAMKQELGKIFAPPGPRPR